MQERSQQSHSLKVGSLLIWTGAAFAAAVLILLTALLVWIATHRQAPSEKRVVDLRVTSRQQPHYLLFCCRLSDNPTGFPGHCFVIWTSTPVMPELVSSDSAGFFPARRKDQLKSIYQAVPSLIVAEPAARSIRCLDCTLAAIVDPERAKQTQRLRKVWQRRSFRLGTSDCVTFCHNIATVIGLATPSPRYRFPQDYVRELKWMN